MNNTQHNGGMPDADFYHKLLVKIWPPKVPFTLELSGVADPEIGGFYVPDLKHICLNNGGRTVDACIMVAIHEYAHHVHHTEKDSKGPVHGKEFREINQILYSLAIAKGLFPYHGQKL